MSLTWDVLFANSSLVSVNFNLWSGSVRALPKDLGIQSANSLSQALKSGRWMLVPAASMKDFAVVKAAAVKVQETYAQTFARIRGTYWTTDDNVPRFVEGVRGLKPAFDTALNNFCTNLPTYRAEQRGVLAAALLEACRGDTTAQAAALARLDALFPTEEEIRSKFAMNWSVYTISGKDGFANYAGETEEVKNAIEELVVRARTDVLERVQDLSGMLAKHNKIPTRALEPTRRLIAKMRGLNFVGDDVLTEQLDVLENIINASEGATLSKEQTETSLAIVEALLQATPEEAVARAEARLSTRKIMAMRPLAVVEQASEAS